MPFQVHIENYQSIASADLEISGLTIIVGQNNTGKSAIMRALRGPFMNTNGNGYIRLGKDHMCVRHEFSDGKTIQWEKTGKIPQKGKNAGKLTAVKANYNINGQEFNEVGQSVPEEALELGIKPIVIGSEKIWPQIARQVDDVFFLVNRPGYTVAEAVADVDRVGKLNKALRLCEKDTRTLTSERKVREKDRDKLKSQLTRFDGLDEVLARTKEVETLHETADKTLEAFTVASELGERYEASKASVESLQWVEDREAPTLDLLVKAKAYIDVVNRIDSQLEKCQADLDRYSGVEDIEVPGEEAFAKLHKMCELMATFERFESQLESANRDLSSLNFVETLEFNFESELESLRETLAQVDNLEYYGEVLEKRSADVVKIESQIQDAEKELEDAEAELQKFLDDNPRCPTCKQFRKDAMSWLA